MYTIPVEHTGECIYQIFKQPDKFIGKVVGLANQRLTIQQHADILNKHLTDRKFSASKVKLIFIYFHFTSNIYQWFFCILNPSFF